MQAILLVFLGAGLGGTLRHLINIAMPKYLGVSFPYATFLINVTGSFVMGFVVGYLAFKDGEDWTQGARLFLTTGVLGGYTTFSTFSLDALFLAERGDGMLSLLYVVGSVVLSLVAVLAGISIARSFS